MATVHPSRLGLVPQSKPPPPPAPPSREEELKRRLLEKRRAKETSDGPAERDERSRTNRSEKRRDGSTGPDRRGGYRNGNDRDGHEERSNRERDREGDSRKDAYSSRREHRDREDDRQRDDRRDPGRDVERPEGERSRRASPSYRPYDRPPHPARDDPNAIGGGRPPWMDARVAMPPFPPRGGMPPFPPRGGGGGWNGPVDLERRRLDRENMMLSIWPPSPERPYRDDDELMADRAARRKAKKSKSKKSKRRTKYSDSDSSSTDSEEERRRSRRRKEKDRERRKRYSTDDSEDERQRKRRKSRDRSERERSRPSAHPEDHDHDQTADQWVEKGGEVVLVPTAEETARLHLPIEDDDDDEVGPHLPVEHTGRDKHREKYHNMFYGEAEAMARFAAAGERIPRRGEIGLDSGQIEQFEQSGYVMSGNRHQRMNAVRLRKENQVINAEEKRAILKLQREEQEKKEGAIITQFRELLDERLRKND